MPRVERIPSTELSLEQQQELERQISFEIERKSTSETFLPDMYRKLRRKGYAANEIRYDMCHAFR